MSEEKNDGPIKMMEKAKKITKNTKKMAIIAGVICGIMIIAACQYFITIDDGSYKENDMSNTGYVVNQTVANEYTLGIDLDEKATEIMQKLEEERGDLTKYLKDKDDKTVKDYLKAFIKAELITQYPDLRSLDKIQSRTCYRS